MISLLSSRYTAQDAKALEKICEQAIESICDNTKPKSEERCKACEQKRCCLDIHLLAEHAHFLARKLQRIEEAWK